MFFLQGVSNNWSASSNQSGFNKIRRGSWNPYSTHVPCTGRRRELPAAPSSDGREGHRKRGSFSKSADSAEKKYKKRTLGVFCGILFHVAISGNCGCTWNLYNNKLREGVDETWGGCRGSGNKEGNTHVSPGVSFWRLNWALSCFWDCVGQVFKSRNYRQTNTSRASRRTEKRADRIIAAEYYMYTVSLHYNTVHYVGWNPQLAMFVR